MKKKFLLPNLARVTLLSPLILTGCQTFDGLFGDPSRYQAPRPAYGSLHNDTQQNARRAGTKGTTSSETAQSTRNAVNRSSSPKVPIEPPKLKNPAAPVAKNPSGNVTVPTPNIGNNAVVPSTKAPTMIAPTVDN